LTVPTISRRRLLGLAAASPLAATALRLGAPLQPQPRSPIAGVADALDVFDFDEAARKALPPAHYGYLSTGTDDDATLRANRDGFARYQLRPRRLVNVAALDLSVSLFGASYDTPIALAPVGSLRAFHPDGELAAARAAKAARSLQILSTVASHAVEPVNQARGEPVWFQLYATNDFDVTRALVARADKAGCPVLVVTVDNLGNNRLTQQRVERTDTRDCNACHVPPNPRYFVTRPMFSGIDLTRAVRLSPQDWSWDFISRLRDLTRMKIVLKGIVTGEDAELARARGVDGLIVSNHGGRSEDSGRGAIECLAEVVAGAGGSMPVLVDSGFRRGTDIFKALALGAAAVCIGRPYVWGLASFGQPGVEAVLAMLRRELELVMRQSGTPSLAAITPRHIVRP
jgi:isopentenyl diphosphate isomerase/L-lactate dehydrogenase-like FMN-dependent dehydrogenase